MKQENPLAKYALQKFGTKRRNTEGMFENRGGNAARDERRAAKRDQTPMTFADMQATGMARPAPAPMQTMFTGQTAGVMEGEGATASPTTTTPPTTTASSPATTGGSTPPAAPPTAYDARRAAMLANLQAQFSGQRQSLEEDLARRGLAASSIGAGRLGDLAGQQSRAMATLEADLLNAEQDRETQLYNILAQLAPYFIRGGV